MRQELLKNKKRGFVKICSANEANKATMWHFINQQYIQIYIYPPTREQYQISNLLYSLRKR